MVAITFVPVLLRLSLSVMGTLRATVSPRAPLPHRTALFVLPFPVSSVVISVSTAIPLSVPPVAISIQPPFVVSQEIAPQVLTDGTVTLPVKSPGVSVIFSVLPGTLRGRLNRMWRKTALQNSFSLSKTLPR